MSGGSARRFLALVFPMLPFERLRETRPQLFVDQAAAPVALTETVGGTERLAMVDPAARRAGLAVGDLAAAARAAAPGLITVAADPHGDCDWLERLAGGFTRYTPQVRLDPADGLTLDLSGAPETDAALVADIEARMARRGMLVRHAAGGTPAVARALARFAGGPAPDEAGAVRRLPVAALELEAEETEALLAAGLRTVGDVATRPEAVQFGRSVQEAVRGLTDRRAPLPPPPSLSGRQVERTPDQPIVQAKPVLAAVESALAQLVEALIADGEGGWCWEAGLFTRDGRRLAMRVDLPEPSQAVAPVLRAMAARWGTLGDQLAAAGGCDLVRVCVVRAAPIGTGRLALEGGAAVRPERAAPVRRSSRKPPAAQPQLGLFCADAAAGVVAPVEPPAAPIPLFGPSRPSDPGDGEDAARPTPVHPSRGRGGAMACAWPVRLRGPVRGTGLPLRRAPPQIAGQ
ncbi:DNA polymerase Y family protein [Sphingomonas sp. S-NIH.Pt15_0812]|uniref:DNA polymerase Y family protein n=1 Tax=Sphingomonas sp. S-NIH.Pt15_0812 TaxID=1920129 RepID=UPI000F7D8BE6|nr:DNA polymerase Y family protein [Sphingomonas sp. S-NIH.Pt15_0812]